MTGPVREPSGPAIRGGVAKIPNLVTEYVSGGIAQAAHFFRLKA